MNDAPVMGCALCGSTSHNRSACPWQKPRRFDPAHLLIVETNPTPAPCQEFAAQLASKDTPA